MRNHALSLAAYVVLALLFTYPLAADFSAHVPRGGDAGLSLWKLWWVRKALTEGHNIYHTDYMFHPVGVNLVFYMPAVLNLMFGSILQQFFTLIESHNLIILLSIVLSAYGMYLLARHLSNQELPSLVAGLIYGFSPYRMGEVTLGHLHTMSVHWIPFYVLYMLKGSRWAALFLVLTALSSPSYFGFLVMFTLIYFLYRSWRDGVRELMLLGNIAVSLLAYSPILLPMMKEMLSESYMNVSSIASEYSIDLLELPETLGYTVLLLFIIHLHRLGVFKWIGGRLRRARHLIADFRVVLLVVGVPILFYFIQPTRNPILYVTAMTCTLAFITLIYLLSEGRLDFWSLCAFTFIILSLGPTLKVGGRPVFILPYIFLQYLPLFSIFRTPLRFTAVSMLALSVTAALNLKGVNRKLLVAFTALVVLEFLTLPYPITRMKLPDAYGAVGGNVVLDVPVAPVKVERDYVVSVVYYPHFMYYATQHERKLVGGYGTRVPQRTLDYLPSNAFIATVMYSGEYTAEQACDSLESAGVNNVVVHWSEYTSLYKQTGADRLGTLLDEMPCLKKMADGDIEVYAVG